MILVIHCSIMPLGFTACHSELGDLRSTFFDAGPTLKQHLVNTPCLPEKWLSITNLNPFPTKLSYFNFHPYLKLCLATLMTCDAM